MANNAREMALTKLYTKYETDLNVSKHRAGADIATDAREGGKGQCYAQCRRFLDRGVWPGRIGTSQMADSGYSYRSDTGKGSWFS